MDAIPYKTIRDDLITLFRDNKSTLNTGLTEGKTFTANTNIKAGNPLITNVFDYPSILVRMQSRNENFHTVGARQKLATVVLNVFPMTQILTDGQADEDETMILTANVEKLIRDNTQFSAGVHGADPASVDFFPMVEGSTYVSVAMIDVQVKYLVK